MKTNKPLLPPFNIRKGMCFLLMLSYFFVQNTSAQLKDAGRASEALVVYNEKTAKTDLPFDKRFTLQINQINTAGIKRVYAFQSSYINGERVLWQNANKQAIFDMCLDTNINGNTLNLHFPPLKPNKGIDIAIVRTLSGENLEALFSLNQELASNGSDAQQFLDKLLIDTKDNLAYNITFFMPTGASLSDYQRIYNSSFAPFYNRMLASANFPSGSFPDINEVNTVTIGLESRKIKYENSYIIARFLQEKKMDEIFSGYLPANYTALTRLKKTGDFKGRIANLEQSIRIFDEFNEKVDAYLSLSYSAPIEAIRSKVAGGIVQLSKNKAFFEGEFKGLMAAVQSHDELNQVEMILTSTTAGEIKTEGSNIFTLDLGIAGIPAWDATRHSTFITKLYYGINIYLRPINKNTRRETLPRHLKQDLTNGPVNDIPSRYSAWQNVSITVGLAVGGFNNPDFTNLYNNTSILLGGGYRFKRAYKLTAGAAFMRRASANPVITTKGLYVSPYLSASVDIDLIDGIKDIYKKLFP